MRICARCHTAGAGMRFKMYHRWRWYHAMCWNAIRSSIRLDTISVEHFTPQSDGRKIDETGPETLDESKFPAPVSSRCGNSGTSTVCDSSTPLPSVTVHRTRLADAGWPGV